MLHALQAPIQSDPGDMPGLRVQKASAGCQHDRGTDDGWGRLMGDVRTVRARTNNAASHEAVPGRIVSALQSLSWHLESNDPEMASALLTLSTTDEVSASNKNP
jgi:hypothetical protein